MCENKLQCIICSDIHMSHNDNSRNVSHTFLIDHNLSGPGRSHAQAAKQHLLLISRPPARWATGFSGDLQHNCLLLYIMFCFCNVCTIVLEINILHYYYYSYLENTFENAPRGMPQDLTDDKSPLVQVMAWCCQEASHCLSQCWLKSSHHLLPLGHNELMHINYIFMGSFLLISVSKETIGACLVFHTVSFLTCLGDAYFLLFNTLHTVLF